MPSKEIRELLEKEHVKYTNIKHSPAYTATEIAQSAHVPGKELAKTVIVKLENGQMAMVVLRANDKINFDHLEKALGTHHLELATEREFQDKFPGCEVGAMPPFGNLYGMEVYVDSHLTDDDEIVFNAGSHSELIKMDFRDFERLVHPKVLHAA